MQQRKRLLKANRKPVDSFDQVLPFSTSNGNLLNSIQNQNLYLKLVGIALEMSREAGVHQNTLTEIEQKLLASKGFQEYSMLNHEIEKQKNKELNGRYAHSYNLSKKFIDPEEQLAFLNKMQKQVQQAQAKEHIIYALKKYIQEKKKTLRNQVVKNENLTRAKVFIQKAKAKCLQKKIHRSNFYGQTFRQIISRLTPEKSMAYDTLRNMSYLKTVWGHTFFSQAEQQYCPVYNAIFDNSQKLIITGGQDGKIKVWSRQTGGLVSTLQGHKDYINKISVTKSNRIVLSAAQDGIRFFDLDDMSSLGGFQTESIMDIGEVMHKNSEESSIIFANNKKLFVLPTQTIFSEKNRKLELYDFKIYNFGSQINSNTVNTNTLTINPQGIVFLGFTEGQILIFDFNKLKNAEIDEQNFSIVEGMPKIPEFVLPIICVLNAHEADILEIKWNPVLSCFSTGAKKDGVCKIWEFKPQDSLSRPIVTKELKIPKYKMKRKKKIYNCNFCCWNSTFTHITCSFQEQQQEEQSDTRGDGEVIVYNAGRMEVTWQMSKTIDLSSIRAMDSHPFYPNIMVICDSYGKIMLTDIYQNYIINIFEERAFHLNHPSFCLVPSQCRFSQDGLTLIVATQYGNVSIYGYDVKDFYTVFPTQQLFSSDYEDFQIDPKTYKPVVNLQSTVDINLFNGGTLQNIRHQPYPHIVKINPKQLRRQIQYPTCKEGHRNVYSIQLQEVQRISQCYLQFERNTEIFRQNIDQIENKRMTILYEEQQARQNRFKEIIQQKMLRIKEVDQNISLGLINNTSFYQNNSSISQHVSQTSSGIYSQDPNLIYNIREEHTEQQQPRRRGRRSTRNTTVANSNIGMVETRTRNARNYNEDSDDANEENIRDAMEEEEEYKIEGEASQDEEVESEQQEEDDDQEFDEDNESEDIYPNSRARAKAKRVKRRIQRGTANQNTNSNNNRRRLVRDLRTRRPANQVVPELLDAYQLQYGRLRKRAENSQQNSYADGVVERSNPSQEELKQQIRRVASRSVTQMRNQRNQRQICKICSTNRVTVTCFSCKNKRYCDGCRSFRGKKINQNTNYICFQCYYETNNSPQAHKNVSYEKYIMTQRTDLFVPQIGDEVAYFFQGYEEFLYDKVQILNNKYINLGIFFDIVPHQNKQQLTRVQKCTITEISYAFPLQQSYQLSYQNKRGARGRYPLKSNIQDILTLLTLRTANGIEFKVFHSPGYEYLLKWEIYEDIIKNDRYGKFKLNHMVRIKDQEVQIIEIRPLNPKYDKSIWKNIIVHKAENKFSRRTRDKNDDIAINIWNIDGFIDQGAFQYKSTFPASSREHYTNQILKVQAKDEELWEIFGEFVSTEIYPTYVEFVEVSMCLRLILDRLQNNYYVTEQSFIKDVKMLVQNSVQFNGRDSKYTKMAETLVKIILEGENYNHDNEQDQTTQKKTKPKRRLNANSSGSFNRDHYEQEKQQKYPKKKQVKDISPPNKRSTRRKKQIEESEDIEDDYEQEQESEDDYSEQSGKMRRKTRNYGKVENKRLKQTNGAYRVTRSRTKN